MDISLRPRVDTGVGEQGMVQGLKAHPHVYWDTLGLVACVSMMMVMFICGAIGFLGYKVCVQDDECEDIELHPLA